MAVAVSEYTWGLGRRKSAVARVRIKSGTGQVLINKRPGDEYFVNRLERKSIREAFVVAELVDQFDVVVNVKGGGTSAQADAVRLGIARALRTINAELEPKLKEFDLLTRDGRMKERKKCGLRGARKGTQFSKR